MLRPPGHNSGQSRLYPAPGDTSFAQEVGRVGETDAVGLDDGFEEVGPL